jgi:hypothetical protein
VICEEKWSLVNLGDAESGSIMLASNYENNV